ncbi:MAG: SDR family oxidoreductase [Bacteroidales bacterium]|nr:SDR family oxidoreductase [Bacteroidales bacterium]
MKALVAGGSSGIGLSIVLDLVGREEFEQVYVLDKAEFPNDYKAEKVVFSRCDFAQGDLSVLDGMNDIQALFITAGFGHLKLFQELSDDYIQDSFSVNSVAPIRILRHYYSRLLSQEDFYCAVMVSIAARLSSPLFSVYSATKAALSKFIEAVNVELDVQGSQNRILEVSPGSMKGTSFTGGVSHPEQTAALALEIIERAMRHEDLFIPQYEDVFKDVIARYEADAHGFGVDSYWYKKKQGRV